MAKKSWKNRPSDDDRSRDRSGDDSTDGTEDLAPGDVGKGTAKPEDFIVAEGHDGETIGDLDDDPVTSAEPLPGAETDVDLDAKYDLDARKDTVHPDAGMDDVNVLDAGHDRHEPAEPLPGAETDFDLDAQYDLDPKTDSVHPDAGMDDVNVLDAGHDRREPTEPLPGAETDFDLNAGYDLDLGPDSANWQAGVDDLNVLDDDDDEFDDAGTVIIAGQPVANPGDATLGDDDLGSPGDYNPVSDFVPAGEVTTAFEGSLPPESVDGSVEGEVEASVEETPKPASTPPPPPASLPESPPVSSLPRPPVDSDGFEEFDPSGVGTVFGTLDLGGPDAEGAVPTGTIDDDQIAEARIDASVDAVDVDAEDGAGLGGTQPLDDRATIVEPDEDATVLIGEGELQDLEAGSRTDHEVSEDPVDPTATQQEHLRGTFLDDSDVSRTIDPSKLPEKDREVWRNLVKRQEDEALDGSTSAEMAEGEAADRRLIIQQRRVRNAGDSGVELADYEVINSFAEGGMGKIYLARQQSVNRAVALKMLKPDFENDVRQREGFLSEAVVTSDLDHPNIVPVHDLARTEDHQLFYAMKLVSGTPWNDAIKARSRDENLEILMKVADGVAFAHSRGVVHRDLKPENVMLGDYGEVLVMDWGLAVVTADFEKPESIRQTNSRGGSPAYMAPEMVTGPVRRIDSSADVYLLGAILYEIVTGHPPHSGSNVSECIRAAASNTIVPTRERGELVDIAMRAMATLPEDRYASVRELQDAIRSYQSHSESLVLSDRAAKELEGARRTHQYEDYAKAVFGFEEAQSLWGGNVAAAEGAREARQEYARAALDKEDFDLGISTLDASEAEHQPLLAQLEEGRRANRARQGRIRTMNRVAAGLVAVMLVGAAVALFFINAERTKALAQEELAKSAARKATEQEQIANDSADEAKRQKDIATEETAKAQIAAAEAKKQQGIATTKAKEAELAAEEARKQERIATANLDRAKQAAFLSWVNERKSRINQQEAENQRKFAVAQSKIAVEESENARLAQENARRQELDALFNAYATTLQEAAAQVAAEEATKKAVEAAFQEHLADAARAAAQANFELAQESAREAERARDAQEYESYIAQTQLAAERIDDGSFQVAANILRALQPGPGKPDFRGWEWYRLAHVTQLQVWSKPAPTGVSFESAAFSRDGSRFAVAGSDGKVRVWTADGEGEPIATLDHGDTAVRVLAFAPTGDALLTGTEDGSVHRWQPVGDGYEDTPAATRLRGAVTSLAFTADTRRWATGTSKGDVVVWNADAPVATLQRHRGAIRDLVFLANGTRLVSAGQDGRAVVWNLEGATGTVAAEFLGHSGRAILSVAYNAKLDRVATGGVDGRVLLWDPSDPGSIDIEARIQASLAGSAAPPKDEWKFVSLVPSAGDTAHREGVRALRFSGDGTRLVSGSSDRSIRVWDLASGEVPTLLKTLEGHGDAIESLAVRGDDANGILSVDAGGLRFWNVARYREKGVVTERVLAGHEGPVTSAGFDPASGRVVSASTDHTVRQWNPTSGDQLATYRDGHDVLASAASFVSVDGRSDLIATAAAFVGEARLWDAVTGAELAHLRGTGRNAALVASPDGRWIATGGDDNVVLLWDVATSLADGDDAEPTHRLVGHDTHVSALAFSSDSQRIYSGDDEGEVLEWSTSGGRPNRLGAHWGRVNAIIVLPNGDVLSASTDKTIERWTRTAGRLRKQERPLAHPGTVVALAGATDGSSFVSVARDESKSDAFVLQQWDAATNTVSQSIAVKAPLISGVAIDPSDANRVVTVEGGRELRVWTMTSGREQPQRVPAWSAVFSPTGDRLLTVGGSNATMWSFDADGLERLRRFEPHGTVNSAAYSSDGRYIASVGSEGAVKIWPASELESATPAAAFTLTSGQSVPGIEEGRMHTGGVNTVTFAPGPPVKGVYLLATGGADRSVKLWKWIPGDDPRMELVSTRTGHTGAINRIAFSTDGEAFVSASNDGTARVWSRDDADAQPVVLRGGDEPLRAAAFGPVRNEEGALLVATAGADDDVRIWTIGDDEPVLLKGHGDDVTSVAWSPDGRRLLSGSRDGTAKVWDTPLSWIEKADRNEGRELLTLQPTGAKAAITSVAFSTNRPGEPLNVLTGSENGTLVIWMADAVPVQ